MSWLYSQALVEEYSAASCSDGEPSAQLNVMPTPHKFLRNDKTIEPLSLSRFGLTCAVLTEDRGEELLTWFREGFLARTSQLQEKAQESQASAAGFGARCLGSFAKWDHDSFLWRTHQRSLLGDFTPYSETWPRWGSMHDGECWEQSTPLTLTETRRLCMIAIESGFVQKAPTATCQDNDQIAGQYANPKSGTTLGGFVRRVLTPTAQEYGSCQGGSSGREGQKNRPSLSSMARQDGGQLNPDWVEWLMGWPIGWTDLKPLEMDRFRKWPLWPGGCSDKSPASIRSTVEAG